MQLPLLLVARDAVMVRAWVARAPPVYGPVPASACGKASLCSSGACAHCVTPYIRVDTPGALVMLVLGIAGTELEAANARLQHDAAPGSCSVARNSPPGPGRELSAAIQLWPLPKLSAWIRKRRVQRFPMVTAHCVPGRFWTVVRRGSGCRAQAGGRTRLADGQRNPCDRRRPQLRTGGGPWSRQSRHRRPCVLGRSAGRGRVHPRLRARHACGRDGGDAQAFPGPRLGAGRHAFR